MAESHLPGVDPDAFKAALGRWASGITVVTAAGPDGPVGLTVSAFSSLSLHPPLVLVCIGHASWTHDLVTQAPGFGVHILATDQEEVSNTFAFSREDRFKDLPWEGGHHGVPMLEGAHARLGRKGGELECQRQHQSQYQHCHCRFSSSELTQL